MTKGQKALKSLHTAEPQSLVGAIGKLQACCEALKKSGKAKGFDRTVTLTARIAHASKPGEATVRGSVSLPNGVGKAKRVAVFARPDRVQKLIELGAAAAGGADLAGIIKEGTQEFDVVLASPDMMGVVGPLGRFLGPKGLMPSPKSGTVTDDVEGVLGEFMRGRVEFRADSAGNVHIPVGKMSFESGALSENISAAQTALQNCRPTTHRGSFVKVVWLTATMLPAYRLADETGGNQ